MAINLYSKASVDSLLTAKLSISSLTNAAATTLNATAPTTDQVLSFDGTELKWATPAGGTAVWGGIIGTLSDQTDLNTALGLKAPLASPTFTGNPTAPTPATSDNDTSIATTAFVKAQGYLTSSAAASTYYPLSNPSNFVIPNGTTSINVTGGTVRSIDGSDNFTSLDGSALNFGNLGSGVSGLSVTGTGITFADSTVQTTAGIGDAPSDSQTYGRNNGAWVVAGGGGGSGTLTYSSPYIYDTATASYINSLDLSSGTLTCGQVIAGNGMVDSTGLTLTASSGAVITFADATTQSTAPHDLPIGGTTGQVLTKNSATDYDASWATAGGGGGGGVDLQTFGDASTSGTFTWTKPANAKWVEIWLFGAGGGGGAGFQRDTATIRTGGGGGSGGSCLHGILSADQLGSTESVVVPAGGAGGAPRGLPFTGLPGGTPANTTFGNFRAFSGQGGGGGNNSGAAGGSGRTPFFFAVGPGALGAGGAGTSTTGTGGSNSDGNQSIPNGGGGGGGATAGSTANKNGGPGGGRSPVNNASGIDVAVAGGAAGTTAGVQATDGTSSTTQYTRAGTGGGGGYYITGAVGGTGGNGGWPGGGGGGGGASDAGFSGGPGGNGGNGLAVIITYC